MTSFTRLPPTAYAPGSVVPTQAPTVVSAGAPTVVSAAPPPTAAYPTPKAVLPTPRVNCLTRSKTISNVEHAVIAKTPYRLEQCNIKGFTNPLPLSQYRLNQDPNPDVIRKPSGKVNYIQEVAVRHLRPPTPPKPGDLVIKEFQRQIPAAPPLHIKKPGLRAPTPLPLVYREAPPRPPTRPPTQLVEVEGAPIPPPARKVIVEKFPDQPPKPQNILIEKWLPYKKQARRVVFQRSACLPPPNPKNVLIQWEQPDVEVTQVCKDLGCVRADPDEYIRRFAPELRLPHEIPALCSRPVCLPPPPPPPPVTCIQAAPACLPPPPAPTCVSLPAPTCLPQPPAPTTCTACTTACAPAPLSASPALLEGDVEALKLLDLDKLGLGHYKQFI